MADKGQANFGDIMQEGSAIRQPVHEQISHTSWVNGDPFLRVVLTANGNLQRIMSSWYHDKVEVTVEYNEQINEDSGWDDESVRHYSRKVRIAVAHGGTATERTFCVATSRITLTDSKAIEAVESKKIGIAQLFHHFGLLPHFRLTDAGEQSAGDGQTRLWREYVLGVAGIDCRIREDFAPDFLNLSAKLQKLSESDSPETPKPVNKNHFGDLMKGTDTWNTLEGSGLEDATNFQKVILTCSGNLIRILSAYHECDTYVGVLENHQEADGTYRREVLIFCRHVGVVRARSRISIEDEKIAKAVADSECALGEVFRHFDLLPQFNLLDVQASPEGEPPGFGRQYELRARGITCNVTEEFSNRVLDLTPPSGQDKLPGIPMIYPRGDNGTKNSNGTNGYKCRRLENGPARV